MNKYFIVLILCLSGCTVTPGYEVNRMQHTEYKYKCEQVTGKLANDLTIAICDTKQECNQICESKRNQK